jgi:membrane-bound inhibitor of C-type lysozyme
MWAGMLAALAACAADAPLGEPTGQRRVQFACDNGQAIEMRFFPLQGVGVLVRDGQTMELQQQPAASGFVYSNGPTTVRGKGDELALEIGRMRPIACRAR